MKEQSLWMPCLSVVGVQRAGKEVLLGARKVDGRQLERLGRKL